MGENQSSPNLGPGLKRLLVEKGAGPRLDLADGDFVQVECVEHAHPWLAAGRQEIQVTTVYSFPALCRLDAETVRYRAVDLVEAGQFFDVAPERVFCTRLEDNDPHRFVCHRNGRTDRAKPFGSCSRGFRISPFMAITFPCRVSPVFRRCCSHSWPASASPEIAKPRNRHFLLTAARTHRSGPTPGSLRASHPLDRAMLGYRARFVALPQEGVWAGNLHKILVIPRRARRGLSVASPDRRPASSPAAWAPSAGRGRAWRRSAGRAT